MADLPGMVGVGLLFAAAMFALVKLNGWRDRDHLAVAEYRIAELVAECIAKDARIAELAETLEFAASYKGLEARACPLCRYDNGVFLGRCQMHSDMDDLRAHIEKLEKVK